MGANPNPWAGALFNVSGKLAARYAEALKSACGRECPLNEFQVDRLGWSPQLAALLGRDYLACDALRYAIILSPDQGEAPLLMRRFSYEAALAGQVYQAARPTLLNLIEHEPVIVELDNGLSFCRGVTDVLAIKRIEACLRTPRETLSKTGQLLGLAEGLRREARLLDDAYIGQMLALVKEVGDPERRPLPPPLLAEADSLWADLDSPIYVLRGTDRRQAAPIVITIRPDLVPRDLPCTPAELAPELVDMLHALGYLNYLSSEAAFEGRIEELERDALLGAGMQFSAGKRERRRQLTQTAEVKGLLPPIYWELDSELKRLQAGGSFNPQRLSVEGRWAVSAPARAHAVIVHLLARFVRYDYRLLAAHHARSVQAEWPRYSAAKRNYLAEQFPLLAQLIALGCPTG